MGKYHRNQLWIIGRTLGDQEPPRRRGMTLLECMWALVIVPMAVVAIAYAVTAGQMQSLEALYQERARALAEDLLEEILSLPYDPVTDDGIVEAQRWLFDDATDYSGFSEAALAVKSVDRLGGAEELYPDGFQRFSRSVAMTECQCGGGAPACNASLCNLFDAVNPPAMYVLSVTVTVMDGEREMVELMRIRTAEVN